MKYVIEITEVATCPHDWTKKENWPGPGLYKCTSENYHLYQVTKHGVNYLSFAEDLLLNPYKEQGEAVSESLLLKAIAAASQAKVLS